MYDRIRAHIAREVYLEREAPVHKFVLKQVSASEKLNEVASFKVPAECTDASLDELAREIELCAQADADGLGGRQKYMLHGIAKGGKGGALCRLPFRMDGADGASGGEGADDIGSEPGTPKGLLTQLMRHNEVNLRTAVSGADSTMRTMRRIIEVQAEQIQDAEKYRFKTMELVESLYSRKQQRELELMKEQNAEKRSDQLFEGVTMLAPFVVNRLAGKNLLPEPESLKLLSMRKMFESITGEQFEKIMGALDMQQKIAMMEMMNTFAAEEEAKAGKSGNGSNGSGSGSSGH